MQKLKNSEFNNNQIFLNHDTSLKFDDYIHL